jgi:subtilisin family serine protease
MVLPIRVTTGAPTAPPKQIGTAIDVAVSAGATVIMIGLPINLTESGLAAAISATVSHNVVVIVAAQAAEPDDQLASASSTVDSSIPGVLRVGAIAADDELVGSYLAGAVDVLAPGAGIVSLGANGSGEIEGSGNDFAVPFVAGLAALVRARFPELSATQTVRQIEATADHMGAALPDPRYGWGIINPAAAVNGDAVTEPAMKVEPAVESAHWPLRIALLALVWTGAIAGIGLLWRRQHHATATPLPRQQYVSDRQGRPVRDRHVRNG